MPSDPYYFRFIPQLLLHVLKCWEHISSDPMVICMRLKFRYSSSSSSSDIKSEILRFSSLESLVYIKVSLALSGVHDVFCWFSLQWRRQFCFITLLIKVSPLGFNFFQITSLHIARKIFFRKYKNELCGLTLFLLLWGRLPLLLEKIC
jgi:hypothetical protein